MESNHQPNNSPNGQGSGSNNFAHAGGGGGDEPPPSNDLDGDARSSDGSVKSEMDENAVTPEGGDNRLCYPSEDPEMFQKRIWTYDPTPQSEDEMLKAAFKGFEELITMYLYCKPLKGNTGI
ncbi:hypothetical protein L218DRAFT_1009073 [Marasmius fiardii PR-910]|nr:hypothetical protein L218DRAFT_1009073 [Marasmius fiardii PR-910]